MDESAVSSRASALSRRRRGTRSLGECPLPTPAVGNSPPCCSAPIPRPGSAAASLWQARVLLDCFGRRQHCTLGRCCLLFSAHCRVRWRASLLNGIPAGRQTSKNELMFFLPFDFLRFTIGRRIEFPRYGINAFPIEGVASLAEQFAFCLVATTAMHIDGRSRASAFDWSRQKLLAGICSLFGYSSVPC